jgi:hypothetical protein
MGRSFVLYGIIVLMATDEEIPKLGSLANKRAQRLDQTNPSHESLAHVYKLKADEMRGLGYLANDPIVEGLMSKHMEHAAAHEDEKIAASLAIVRQQMAENEFYNLEERVQQPVVNMSDLYKRAGKPMNPEETNEPRRR